MPKEQIVETKLLNPFATYEPPTYLEIDYGTIRLNRCSKCWCLVGGHGKEGHTAWHQTLVGVLADHDTRLTELQGHLEYLFRRLRSG